MMVYAPKVIPTELFPGDWCLNCVDPGHPERTCHMLEMNEQEDGSVTIEPCGCTVNVTAGRVGKYVVRVTQVQHE